MYALLNKLLWDDLLVRNPRASQIRIETKFLQRRIRFVYSLFVFSYLNVIRGQNAARKSIMAFLGDDSDDEENE